MEDYLFHGNLVSSSRILYTASKFAKSSLIHLQEVGTLKAKAPHTSSRDGLSSYLFFIIESGKGELKYGGKTYNLQTGDCVFIDCMLPYSHTTSKDLWKLKWLHFQGTNMDSIYQKYIERGGMCTFHPDNLSHYIDIVDDIYDIASSDVHVKDMKIYEKLTNLLSLLLEESWNPDISNDIPSSKKKNLGEIRAFLENHYTEKITLDMLSKKFFINKFYMTRIFKEQYGTTITAYILELRITRAKHFLRFSDMPIDEISRLVGIDDANYFSRIFKKIEGISPASYRKDWAKSL